MGPVFGLGVCSYLEGSYQPYVLSPKPTGPDVGQVGIERQPSQGPASAGCRTSGAPWSRRGPPALSSRAPYPQRRKTGASAFKLGPVCEFARMGFSPPLGPVDIAYYTVPVQGREDRKGPVGSWRGRLQYFHDQRSKQNGS